MSAAALNNKLTRLIKKTGHHDKDERFMAVSDVCAELEQPDCPALETGLQQSLSRSLLSLLDDASTDVQTISVKCLGLLVKKIGGESVREIVDRLSGLILDDGKEDSRDVRDVYVIGMKTIIAHTSGAGAAVGGAAAQQSAATAAGGELGGRCLTRMIAGLKATAASSAASGTAADIALSALEICHQLLLHFSSSLPTSCFEPLLEQLLPRLDSPSPSIAKKSIATLGALTPLLPDRLFHLVMQRLTAGLTGGGRGGDGSMYVYLQGISTVSAAAGSRISRYLSDIVGQLEQACRLKGGDDGAEAEELKEGEGGGGGGGGGDEAEGEEADREREVRMEVYENVLSAFDALLLRCSSEITPFVGNIVAICRRMCKYDPNYAAGDEQQLQQQEADAMLDDGGERKREGGAAGGGWDDEDDADDGLMDDDNDDDDSSWKVRRAALRCLQTFISSKPDLFASAFFSPVFDTLLQRLRERDANVQLAVIDCIATAVKECVVSSREASDAMPAAALSSLSPFPSSASSPSSSHIHSLLLSANLPVPIHARPSLSALTAKLPALFSSTLSLHSRQPLETRRATLEVWKSVVGVMEGGCDAFLPSLLPAVTSDASHADMRLRTDALLLLRLILELHPRALLAPFLPDVCAVCVSGMSASYLKAKAEALRLASSLLLVGKGERRLVQALYDAVYAQLLLTDVDAEVKEAALSTMSLLLSLHHSLLDPAAIAATMPVFLSRLTNEVTRLSALRAITRLTSSPSLPLSSILPSVLQELLVFLKKDNAILRQETMLTLLALVRTQAGKTGRDGGWGDVAHEVEHSIDDRDVFVSTLAMDTMREVLTVDSRWVEGDDELIVRLSSMLQSPLLQGAVLNALTSLFTALVAAASPRPSSAFSYSSLVSRLSKVSERTTTTTLMSTAQCISAIAAQASQTQRQQTVTAMLAAIPNSSNAATTPTSSSSPPSSAASSFASLQLALYVLGGIGRRHDLSQLSAEAFSRVASCLSHPSDAARQAAAFSLGSITTGNLALFLPQLLAAIPADHDKQYLTLTALLTVIQTAASPSSPAEAAESAARSSASPSSSSSLSASRSASLLSSAVSSISPLLFRYCESEEEGVRAIVSECLGGLALLDAKAVLPQLIERVGHQEPKVREVVVTAIRHALPASAASSASAASHLLPAASPSPAAPSASALHLLDLLSSLSTALPAFFPLLSDAALPVQRQALLTFTSLAHSHPALLQPHLDSLLPLLYPALHPLPAHIRVVDLGPFKHRVDDGLPLRTAALTLLSTVFTSPSLAVTEDSLRRYLAEAIRGGLCGDCGDGVAGVVWEDLERLCSCGRWTRLLVQEADGLVPDMMRSIREQLKQAKDTTAGAAAAGAEASAGSGGGAGGGGGAVDVVSKAREVLRVCVRALLALHRLKGMEGCAAYQELYARVLKTQLLVQIMHEMDIQ